MREDNESCVLRQLPILKILKICDEVRRVKILVLRKDYDVSAFPLSLSREVRDV